MTKSEGEEPVPGEERPTARIKRSGKNTVDMSPEAIDNRIRRFCRLMELGLSLKKAKILGPAEVKQES